MIQTFITAYYKGDDCYNEISLAINLPPLDAVRYYLNYTYVDRLPLADGRFWELEMKCYKVRTDGAREITDKNITDVSENEFGSVGTWFKTESGYKFVEPYNKGGNEYYLK